MSAGTGLDARPDSPGIGFPPPLVFVAALALGWGLDRLVPLPIALGAIRPVVVLVGWALVVVWGVLFFPALALFRRARTGIMPNQPATMIVDRGPYRWTRNPMYVGMTGLSLGAALVFDLRWAVLLVPVAVFAVDRFIIPREERYLERRFGDPYRAYRERVRRWL